MGKKVSQSSLRISKNDNNSNNKELNSLVKVLKPKVYIADSSSFKTLVQELTGNGNPLSLSSPPPSASTSSPAQENPFFNIEDHGYQESSFHSLEISIPNPFTHLESSSGQSIQRSFNASETSSAMESHIQMELPHYSDTEPWFSEMEPLPFYDSFTPLIQQEVCDVCLYDYDYDYQCLYDNL
ncbi:unnamed protein product [Ilex paraguariensis]|uniref:VQ domain-containing protein n=1 Tax=Ilex paraguariensis TaxID=185542 RepID=A0ABC8U5V0_9AQUA